MPKTKIVALDIYGTVLATDDPDNELPPRKGTEKFLKKCFESGIKVISASDGHPQNVINDLKDSGVDTSYFDKFLRFIESPKDFREILELESISPLELFVIGDSYEKDIKGAIKIGANYFHVPEYSGYEDDFDLSTIEIP